MLLASDETAPDTLVALPGRAVGPQCRDRQDVVDFGSVRPERVQVHVARWKLSTPERAWCVGGLPLPMRDTRLGDRATMVTTQRIFAVIVVAVLGFFSLPLAAWMLDGSSSTENLIIPFQLLVMALIGAALAWWLPALARPGDPERTRLLKGAGWGLLAGVIGLIIFWFLLSGFGGV